MLTSRGITLVTAGVLAWLAGRTLGIGELYAVSVACLAAVLLGVAYVRLSTGSVSSRRQVDQNRVVAGQRIEVSLELRNDAPLPSPTLLLTEQLPAAFAADGHPADAGEARFVLGGLGPGRRAQAVYTAAAAVRGRYEVGPLEVRVRDPFGAAERVRRYAATTEVVVYPLVEPLPATAVRGVHMGAGAADTRRIFAAGDEFFGIREYVSGDDLRHVHWASTAHRQTLMVRQMEQPWQAHATVFLDTREHAHTGGPHGTLEKAVSAAASVVNHLAQQGYVVRLVTDVSVGRIGPAPWQEAMDRLAVLRPSRSAALAPSLNATRGGEGLFVAVLALPPGEVDPSRHPDMRALHGVKGFGQRLALVTTTPGPNPRAERTCGLLRGSGWQATTLRPGQPLAVAWDTLTRPASRRGAVTA